MVIFHMVPRSEPFNHIRARNIICNGNKQAISIFDLHHPDTINRGYNLCLDLNDHHYNESRGSVQCSVYSAGIIKL